MNKQNNRAETEEVLSRYADMVYRIAYARTLNKSDAEDITQEVFLQYMRHQEQLHTQEHKKAWLIRVTINQSKTLLTSAWHRKRADLEECGEQQAGEDPFAQAESAGILKIVNQLPEKYRVVIYLFYYEELSITEIGQYLGKKETTIKSQLHRARQRLKEALVKEGYDDIS